MTTRLEKIGNRLFNKVAHHPAKTYLHTKLIDDIRDQSEKFTVAADISSSHFANAEYFRSDKYVGIDIERNRLRDGKAAFGDDADYIAVQADILKPILQPQSVGMVVSSHTLSHLKPEEHLPVVELFLEYLPPGGCLLLQMPDSPPSDRIETRLRESFETVERTDYYNSFTRAFQKWQSSDDEWYDPTLAGWRRYLNAAAIVALATIEALNWPNTSKKYFKCVGKK